MPQDWMPKSAEEIYMPKSAEPIGGGGTGFLDSFSESTRNFLKNHPIIQQMFFGVPPTQRTVTPQDINPTPRGMEKLPLIGNYLVNQRLAANKGYQAGDTRNIPFAGTPESEGSILPEWKGQPESFTGGFAQSVYNNMIRPYGTPSGVVGSSVPGEAPIPQPIPKPIPRQLGQGTRFIGGEGGMLDQFNPPPAGTIPTELPTHFENLVKQGVITRERANELNMNMKPLAKTPEAPAPSPIETPVTKSIEAPEPQIPTNIPVKPKEALYNWVHKRNGATVKAQHIMDDFADLNDPSLITKFQAGDRTGRLSEVSQFFDDQFKEAKKLGFLKDEKYKENYLRQFWNNSNAEVEAVFKKLGISDSPGFTKDSVFKDYEAGIQAGLSPKYNTLPEIIGAAKKEFEIAKANRELFDHLKGIGVLTNEKFVSPQDWSFSGPNAKTYATLLNNYFSKSPEALREVAKSVSYSKNISLGGGIPKTFLNAHGWNITRSDIAANGIKAGTGNFFKGLFNPQGEINYIKDNRKLLEDLVDHGMGWTEIEGHAAGQVASGDVPKWLEKSDTVKNLIKGQQKIFEDPLFKVHLPATKLKMAVGRVAELAPKIGYDKALKQAADEANVFYGGIEKSLRNKTYKDLSQIGLLAPDWLESRLRLAGREYKSLVGKADPIYAKALGRELLMSAPSKIAAAAGGKGVYDYFNTAPGKVTNLPIGNTPGGRERGLQQLGTSAEGIRMPEQMISGAINQNNPLQVANMFVNRMSPPLTAAKNAILNEDAFGNRLRGIDKYGRKIPMMKGLGRTANELIKPAEYQWMQGLAGFLTGDASAEEALVKGTELPITYSSPQQPSGGMKLRR